MRVEFVGLRILPDAAQLGVCAELAIGYANRNSVRDIGVQKKVGGSRFTEELLQRKEYRSTSI